MRELQEAVENLKYLFSMIFCVIKISTNISRGQCLWKLIIDFPKFQWITNYHMLVNLVPPNINSRYEIWNGNLMMINSALLVCALKQILIGLLIQDSTYETTY